MQQVGSLFKEEHVVAAAKRHNKSPAQVLLRWATQRGITVIPKSSNPGRLAENLDSTDFDLSEEEIKVCHRIVGLPLNSLGHLRPGPGLPIQPASWH